MNVFRFPTSLLQWRLGLIIVSVLAVLWLQGLRLGDEFQVDQDFRTFYWMHKFQEPALFPGDPVNGVSYYPISILGWEIIFMPTSPGYGFLFYLASFVISPPHFSQLLPLVVVPLTVLYLFEFGRLARDPETGAALAGLFLLLSLASPSSTSILPGLQRSLAMPLIIALVYYLYRHQYLAAASVLVFSALIYPPMFVLGAITWGLFALKLRWPLQWPWPALRERGLALLMVASVISTLALTPQLGTSISSLLSDKLPAETVIEAPEGSSKNEYIWQNPTFRAGGQAPLFFFFPLVGRGGLVNNGEDGVHLLILFSLGGLILWVRGRQALRLPELIWSLLGAGFVAFVLAWLAIWATNAFPLHMPSRYTRVGLFIFILVFVVWHSKAAVTEAMTVLQRNRPALMRLVGLVGLAAVGLVLLYPSDRSMIGGFNMKWLLGPTALIFTGLSIAILRRPTGQISTPPKLIHLPGGRLLIGLSLALCLGGWAVYAPLVSRVDFLALSPAERAMLEFVITLPADALIAGTPCALDNIPLLTKRRVVFNCDMITLDDDLVRQALLAYYATEAQTVIDFCQSFAVDYLVIDSRVYSPDYLATEKIFFEPYHQELWPQIVNQDSFVLNKTPEHNELFAEDPYSVVACDAGMILAGNK